MNCETYFLNLLHNRGNFYSNFSKYLIGNNGSGYSKMIKLVASKKMYRDCIGWDTLFPKAFSTGLAKTINLDKLPLQKLVLLGSSLLAANKLRINNFLCLKIDFEQAVLFADYTKAQNILEEVYENYGLSLWLLDSTSILSSLCNCKFSFVETLGRLEKAYLGIFELKNNAKEKHEYYVKRMGAMITRDTFDRETYNFLNYLLFISLPASSQEWEDIIRYTFSFSYIDMFLSIDSYLRKNIEINNFLLQKSYDNIIEVKNIDNSNYLEHKTKAENDLTILIELFNTGNYDAIISLFSEQQNRFLCTFGAYKLTALTYLLKGISPSDANQVLNVQIVQLVYSVLKKDESSFITAINSLINIARILKNFDIHANLCVFLETFGSYPVGYSFPDVLVSDADNTYYAFENNTKNTLMLPCKAKLFPLSEEEIDDYFTFYKQESCNYPVASNYFKEAKLKLSLQNLISKSNYIDATRIVVDTYIDNKILVFSLDTKPIVDNISQKIKDRQGLSLEELCYIFIDNTNYFLDNRRDCFLDYFDDTQLDEPLDVVNNENIPLTIAHFFLYRICNTRMLPNLYRQFKSTDDVDSYRLKICEYLLENNTQISKKLLREEKERITKIRTLSKKLREVETSRLTINTDSFKMTTYDSLLEEVDAYNNSEPQAMIVQPLSEGIFVLALTNRHHEILRKIYNVYCKEFCFGNHGIDISLSTRVRHGTFSNQILKVFSDNNLSFNGHGSNHFFDELIEAGVVDSKVCQILSSFSDRIQNILDYFTQHTLKVVLDTPIEGAVFNYDIDEVEFAELCERFDAYNSLSVDDVALVLNEFLIRRTNAFLTGIKNSKLPEILNSLCGELETLSAEIEKYILIIEQGKSITRCIVKCKTDIQNEIALIKQWFSLSEYNSWDNYSFSDLMATCNEIAKGLFANFDDVDMKVADPSDIYFNGSTFRHLVDVVLIILNNAVIHSGYRDDLSKLKINIIMNREPEYITLSFQNNLGNEIGKDVLDEKISSINNNFQKGKYLTVNTRQEGGMGLYKVMHTFFSVLKLGHDFSVCRKNDIFSVDIQIKKEILVNEKDPNN